MNIIKAHNLACPLDGLPLTASTNQYVCPSGHNFDVARQAYVNLLPVQQKRSKNPGDSKAMIDARTAFLNSGLYQPIADRFNEIVVEQIIANTNPEQCLLDAGCGEGYYLALLLACISANTMHKDISLIGLDISKPAIIAAAKRSKQITWLVASNKQPPLLSGTVDMIFCLFGFPVFESFKKRLRPGGTIILVEAGEHHLIELRRLIYPAIKEHVEPDISVYTKYGLSLLDESRLTYKTAGLSNAQIMNLLHMTPHLYRASQEGKQTISTVESLELTIDVHYRVLT